MIVRMHVYVSGRVQGVGFRYITSNLARRYAVTGWVRNDYDGRVEIEVQGEWKEVEAFLLEVRRGDRYVRVDGMEMEEIPALPPNKEFKFSVIY